MLTPPRAPLLPITGRQVVPASGPNDLPQDMSRATTYAAAQTQDYRPSPAYRIQQARRVRGMADVFLSYARADEPTAERAARELGNGGCSVWFDRDLPAHRPYSDVIATELECASAVLVFWSKASIGSEWVRSEATRARELHKLVQVRLDTTRLPMPFEQIQCADLINWRGGERHPGWSQVCKSIDALAGGQPTTGPLPKPAEASRRNMLIAGAAKVAIAIGGGVIWSSRSREYSSPEALLLMQKGMDALQNNDVFAAEMPDHFATRSHF